MVDLNLRTTKIKIVKRYSIFFIFCIFSAKTPFAFESSRIKNLADRMEESLLEESSLPRISELSEFITEQEAYLVQRAYVKRQKKRSTLGYKGAFFNIESRQKFKINRPLSGILLSGCVFNDGQIISLDNYPGLRLEIELGFRLRQSIKSSLSKSFEMEPGWFELIPVIEMPQIFFESLKGIRGVDLIAANVAASCWLEGPPILEFDFSKLDRLEIQMFLNGNSIEKVYGNQVGGQKNALSWLISHLLSLGMTLEKGDILLTGKLGRIHPPTKGQYVVKFGSLSRLSFSITE